MKLNVDEQYSKHNLTEKKNHESVESMQWLLPKVLTDRNTSEAAAEELVQIQREPALLSEFKTNQNFLVKPYLKKMNKKVLIQTHCLNTNNV